MSAAGGVVGVSAVVLPEGVRRLPPREPEDMQEGYLESFDAETLFYDVFAAEVPGIIAAVGPPLLNLEEHLEHVCCTDRDGRALAGSFEELDRCAVFAIDSDAEVYLGDAPIAPGSHGGRWFEGRRVLFTKSKDNRLEWIKDWVELHRGLHGADAVLIYDNGSSLYPPEAVWETAAGVEGIEVVVVVAWPFRFGPRGHAREGAKRLKWDSDFCQHGILEHARRRFLGSAASVLCCDIDEVVSGKRGRSVFEAAETRRDGRVHLRGYWVEACDGRGEVRHRDHVWKVRGERPCRSKWCVVPRRVDPALQWLVHEIGQPDPFSTEFFFRHFRGISTSWKYERSGWTTFDPERHVTDDAWIPR